MAHPIGNQYRNDKIERSRVPTITRACGGMASGGGTHSDISDDKALVRKMVKSVALRADGGAVRARADRPNRARGGKVKKAKGGHTVNVIVAPGAPKQPMIPGVAAGPPPGSPPVVPRPPVAPPAGMAPPGSVPPGAGPPGMPMRARGGKVDANNAGIGKGRTPVQHSPNKQDGKNIGRGPVITKATGGPISSPMTGGMGPKFGGGSRGGTAKLAKAHKLAKAGFGRSTVIAQDPTRNPMG